MRSQRRRLGSVLAIVAGVLMLAGCASSSYSSGDAMGESAPQGAAAPDAAAAADPQAVDASADRSLITTGYVGVQTTDVPAAREEIEALVQAHDGRIDTRSESGGAHVSAQLTARVPAEDYDTFIDELREVGDVTSVETSVVDVTLQETDLSSRVSTLEASVTSLRSMLAAATEVDDLLAIETTLTERTGELQSLTAQLEVLQDSVASSTVTISISSDAPDRGNEPEGFLAGLSDGMAALLRSLAAFWTGFGFALPGLVLLAVLGGIVWIAVVLIRRRVSLRRATTSAASSRQQSPASAAPERPDERASEQ